MPNGFTFESPLNRLLSETVPRFIEGQLSRESRERMEMEARESRERVVMEEISFREEQNRLDRIQRQQEADLARKDMAIESEFNRRMKISEQSLRSDMFEEQKRINREKDRAEDDEYILGTFEGRSPTEYLELTKDLTLKTGRGAQALSDKRAIAQMNVDQAQTLSGLSDFLINKRAKALFGKKIEMGDYDGALGLVEDAPNTLSPEDQIEASFITQEIKEAYKRMLPGATEANAAIKTEIEGYQNELRGLFGKKPAEVGTKEDGEKVTVGTIIPEGEIGVGKRNGKKVYYITTESGVDPEIRELSLQEYHRLKRGKRKAEKAELRRGLGVGGLDLLLRSIGQR